MLTKLDIRRRKVDSNNQTYQNNITRYQKSLIYQEIYRLTGYTMGISTTLEKSHNRIESEDTEVRSTLNTANIEEELICQVQCKLVHRNCSTFLPVTALLIGSVVLITAGEHNSDCDIGVIVRIFTIEQFKIKQSKLRPSNDKEENVIHRIIRLAAAKECEQLPGKYNEEEKLLKHCQYLVESIYRLPMEVYGADFQFDRRVLTFYYTSEVRVDYSELVRSLFNYCAIRIKMRKTNQCRKFVPVPFATITLQTGIINHDQSFNNYYI